MSQTGQQTNKTIGFVGFGNMGQPMASRLLVAGVIRTILMHILRCAPHWPCALHSP